MRIPLSLLLTAVSALSTVRSQQLLHDDFSGPVNPAHWAIVTPGASSTVSVQNGECVLEDRGYLKTVSAFDPVALGGIRVAGQFRFGGTYDYLSVLTRCDGVPTGPFGNAQNGIALDISWETAPYFFLSSRSSEILTGATNWLGGGFQPVPGTDYTFTLADEGQLVRARVDGPNGQWAELELPIVADTTTAKHVVFHNREPVGGTHLCYLDDVSIERLTPSLRWRQATTSAAPPSPRGIATAFDAHRGRLVAFGGCQVDYPFNAIVGASAETWEWDGVSWQPQFPANSPSARFYHSMAYDAARHRVVMFGGRDANGANPTDTTWEYDGVTWVNVTLGSGPIPREVTSMVYDEARQQCVLFGGGFAGASGHLSDTWTWDGTQWLLRAPQHSPTARWGHAMAYDSTGARTFLFGGTISGGFANDLWQWDGTDWTEIPSTTSSPVARHYHALTYDPTRDQLILFGGDPGNYQLPLGDTWTWHNGAWEQQAPTPAPSARRYPAMAYDSVRHEAVLFGGEDMGNGPHGNASDTWTFASDDSWFVTFGAGCPGSNQLTPTLAAGGGVPARIGQTFVLEVNQLPPLAIVVPFFGGSTTSDGSTALPRDLTPIGMTGCTQWVSIVTTRLLLGVGGQAQWNIPIPNAAFLVGLHAHFQAAVWDATANPLGITASNAATSSLGW